MVTSTRGRVQAARRSSAYGTGNNEREANADFRSRSRGKRLFSVYASGSSAGVPRLARLGTLFLLLATFPFFSDPQPLRKRRQRALRCSTRPLSVSVHFSLRSKHSKNN